MKRYYWIVVPVALAAIGWLWIWRGPAAGIAGAGLWFLGLVTYKQRRYIEGGLGAARTSFVEKARAWLRG
jgi:TM2 domain-containing membrane protein YozV